MDSKEKVGSGLAPLLPSHGDSFARFAIPECFLGFEMANVSAVFSKQYKVYNHRVFFKGLKGNKVHMYAYYMHRYYMHTYYILHAYKSFAHSHMCCTYLHTYVTVLIPF